MNCMRERRDPMIDAGTRSRGLVSSPRASRVDQVELGVVVELDPDVPRSDVASAYRRRGESRAHEPHRELRAVELAFATRIAAEQAGREVTRACRLASASRRHRVQRKFGVTGSSSRPRWHRSPSLSMRAGPCRGPPVALDRVRRARERVEARSYCSRRVGVGRPRLACRDRVRQVYRQTALELVGNGSSRSRSCHRRTARGWPSISFSFHRREQVGGGTIERDALRSGADWLAHAVQELVTTALARAARRTSRRRSTPRPRASSRRPRSSQASC